jgi:diguanylate cyclase (GGDEF)-like protein
MSQSISLTALEDLIASGNLKFTPELQRAFDDDRKSFLSKVARSIILRSLITYNIYLPLDIFLLPKTWAISTALHFLVVTPYFIFAGLMLRRRPGILVRDGMAAFFPVLQVIQIMIIYRLNTGLADWQYQYFAVMVIVYTNINQMLDMRFALFATFLSAFIYLAAIITSPCPVSVKAAASGMAFAAALLSLEAKARLERGYKQHFLRRLRDRLQRFEAENAASRDALTGLSNRRHLDERATVIWLAARAPAMPVAIIMLDIDHFKLFNDHYGHPAGDHCIKRVAGAISSVPRGQADLAVRFGGEEFLLLLPGATQDIALQTAERVRRAVEVMAIPHEPSPTSPVVTVSLGVATGDTAASFATILAAADTALYQAKRAGRNQVVPPFMSVEKPPQKNRRAAV